MKSTRRIIIVIIVLLLLAGAWYLWFSNKTEKRSLSLAQRIPDAPMVIRVSPLELTKIILTGGPFKLDSMPSKWSHLIRPPQEIGVDLFSDQWVFGDSLHLSYAFNLTSISKFGKYVQEIIGDHYTISLDSNKGYYVCNPIGEAWQMAWNSEGQALITSWSDSLSSGNGIVETFFTSTDTNVFDWIRNDVGVQAMIKNRSVLPWYLTWLDSGLYNMSFSGNGLYINDFKNNAANMEASFLLFCPEKSTEWLSDAVKHLKFDQIFKKLEIQTGLLTEQRAVMFRIDTIYVSSEKFMTYTYDDEFNKVPVVSATSNNRLSWELRCYFNDSASLGQLEQLWKEKGLLKDHDLYLDNLIVPIRSKGSILTCGSWRAGVNSSALADTISTNKTHLVLNIGKLQRSLKKCNIAVPQKYQLSFDLVQKIEWEGNAGVILFNASQGNPLSSLIRLGLDFSK